MAGRPSDKQKINEAEKRLENEGYTIIEPNRCMCIHHPKGKKNILSTVNFYDTSSVSIYRSALFGKIPICKDCINQIYQNYFSISKNIQWSVYSTLRLLDIPYIKTIYDGAVTSEKIEVEWTQVLGRYMRTYNSLKSQNGWDYNFDNSEEVELTFNLEGEVKINNADIKWSNKDRVTKKDVIAMLGYDPFEGYNEVDQKFLYNDIINYLNEEILEDQYKVSAIIQIVDNNNQIRKYQYVKNQYSSEYNMILENTDKLQSLEKLIKTLVENNDKIAKENAISEKNKKTKSQNSATLTGKMKKLRAYNLDDLEVDFYDQKKAYGMKRAAEISNKAIASQIRFDDNDANEIITYQREKFQDMENEILELKESLRIKSVELQDIRAGGKNG